MSSVSTPMMTAAFPDSLNKDIDELFYKGMEKQKFSIDSYFHVTDGNDYYQKDSSFTGVEIAAFTAENASVVYDAPLQGYDKTFTQTKFTAGCKISDTLWRFGIKFRGIADKVDGLADAMTRKVDTDGAGMLDNGWSTSYSDGTLTVSTAGGNSVAFFSASQTREDGGSNWNNICYDGTTYNMDFEYDALKALRKTAAAVLGPRGQKMNFEPDTLVCKYGSSVHDRYEELMGAISRNMIPGGDENDGASKVGLPKLITLKYLANDLYWWAFDSSQLNEKFGLQWKWSVRPTILPAETTYDSQEYKRQALMYYTRGANDMRCYYGSTGANS